MSYVPGGTFGLQHDTDRYGGTQGGNIIGAKSPPPPNKIQSKK